MKTIIYISCYCLLLMSCSNSAENKQLQLKVDTLQKKLDNAYKPGLGEFMSIVQQHHAKLYFAGQHENWKLADFEVHEIMEAIDDIKVYAADRPETKLLPMLQPVLDSVVNSITNHDKHSFSKSFLLLTNTCNNCHTQVHFEFNKIVIPANPPVSNQAF